MHGFGKTILLGWHSSDMNAFIHFILNIAYFLSERCTNNLLLPTQTQHPNRCSSINNFRNMDFICIAISQQKVTESNGHNVLSKPEQNCWNEFTLQLNIYSRKWNDKHHMITNGFDNYRLVFLLLKLLCFTSSKYISINNNIHWMVLYVLLTK